MARRYVDELRVSAGAVEELAAHGIIEDEVLEVSWNDAAFYRDKVRGRELMIGKSDGGRLLTVVVQPSGTLGAWDVVTGWDADRGERTEWQKARGHQR